MWLTIGITDLEQRVYRELLRDPQLHAAKCAAALGVSPRDCRAAIRRLVAAGLLERSGPGPNQVRPIDPRVAVGTLVRDRQGELARLAADIDDLATDFYHGRLRANPGLMVEVVEGDTAIAARYRDLLSSAEHHVVCMDSPPYVIESEDCEAIETAALQRGVKWCTLYAADVLNNPGKLAYITAMVAAGEHARLLRSVPLKLLVVDRKTALLPLTTDEDGDRFRCIVLQRSAPTEALYALFDVLWRQAAPWPSGNGHRPGSGMTLTEEERSLLHYLVTGMKDEAIARHIGCSRRTLARHVDALLDKLGATSRFQAGALAAKRGWL